jgi:hypothetical protein
MGLSALVVIMIPTTLINVWSLPCTVFAEKLLAHRP